MATMMTRFGAAGVFLALVLAAVPEGGTQQSSSALQSYQPVTAERLTRAADGDLLWKYNTGAGVFSSPSVYMVNGEQFVTVGSGGGERGRRGGDLILSFALPKQ